MGNGICQALDGFDVFNMQDFDKINRDEAKHIPAVQDLGNNGFFVYKTCGDAFKMKADYVTDLDMETSGCKSLKGSAYLVQDGKCVEAFESAVFSPHKNPDPKTKDAIPNDGFNLKWTSEKICTKDETNKEKFEVNIEGICN
jgi:hypothetical protein